MNIESCMCVTSLSKRSCPAVCGLLVLLKGDLDSESLEERPQEKVLYLRLEQTPTWAQQDLKHNQETITRCVRA